MSIFQNIIFREKNIFENPKTFPAPCHQSMDFKVSLKLMEKTWAIISPAFYS